MKLTKNSLILLLLPLVILLAGFGIVKILNGTLTRGDVLSLCMDREILFPWQDKALTHFGMDFSGEQQVNKSVVPTDVVLILDNSPSMTEMVGTWTKFDIIRDVILNFIDNFESLNAVRIGAILFDRGITQKIPLKANTTGLRNMILHHQTFGNGTDFSPPLQLASLWLKNSNALKKYIIFLTDGEPNPDVDPAQPNRIYRKSLAPKQVDVFMVGVGQQVPFHILRNVITDEQGQFNPNRVLTCHDPLKLQILYDGVAEKIGNVTGRQGSLFIPLAGDAFSPLLLQPHDLRLKYPQSRSIFFSDNQITPYTLQYPVVFSRNYSGAMALKPLTPGIIKPFYRNFQFTYWDMNNDTKKISSGGSPYLLNVTYGTLFWLYLPFLLYQLLSRLGRKDIEPVPPQRMVIPLEKNKTPNIIPAKHIIERGKLEWIPTLVIGLGKTGRHVLTHLKQNLADTTSAENQNIQLLSIDVAESEVKGPQPDTVPGVLVQLDQPSEVYVPDAHIRNVTDIIRKYENCHTVDVEDPLTTLELGNFASLPESITGLDTGSHGHAGLVRAYLFKELEQEEKSPLLQILTSKLNHLKNHAQNSNYVQVIMVANTNGGTGSGLLLPLTVLVQRMIKQTIPKGISSEIHLVLTENRESLRKEESVPIRNRMLLDELDLFSQAGRIPFPFHLVSKQAEDKKNILKGMVSQRSYNNIQVYARDTRKPQLDLYPQVADGLLFLVERSSRIESRPIFDGVKKKEGELRKQEKSEIFTHVACHSLIYPTGLIRQWLKLVLIRDIFSQQIALGGFSYQDGVFELNQRGNVEQLFRHPLISSLLAIEAGGENNKWVAFFLNEKIDLGPGSIVKDSENVWSYLEKAVPLLLNQQVFTLSGLLHTLSELRIKVRAMDLKQRSPQSIKYIKKNQVFLDSFWQSVQNWLNLLLGDNEKKGFLHDLYTLTQQINTIKEELLAMDQCRFVLGLDVNTPDIFQLDNLRNSWMQRWLDTGNCNKGDNKAVYTQLKKRCLWKVVEHQLSQPQLMFEFYGDLHRTFTSSSDFKENILNATEQLSGQFLQQIKEISIIELLSAYEQNSPELYGEERIAKKLYSGNLNPELLNIFMLPHRLSVRLSPREVTYINRLKESINQVIRIGEISSFPRTSNTYRLFSLQVSTLIRGDYQDSRDEMTPFHLTGKLAEEIKTLCKKKLRLQLPDTLPFHYLALVYPQRFKWFCRLWLNGAIEIEKYDGLWTLYIDGKIYKLSRFANEGLEEAAVRYVLDHKIFPAPSEELTEITPTSQRIQYMNQQLKKQNPLFIWMKLYTEVQS